MRPQAPNIPTDIELCFGKQTPPPSGELSIGEVFDLIATLRASEAEKSDCGKRLITYIKTATGDYHATGR